MIDCKKSPCSNCPYRKDAPLRHWSYEEFADLIRADQDPFGKVYGCHKKDGKMCTGWLMNQDKRRLPSIALRMKLSRDGTTVEDLDQLTCPAPMFRSIKSMTLANYPKLKSLF